MEEQRRTVNWLRRKVEQQQLDRSLLRVVYSIFYLYEIQVRERWCTDYANGSLWRELVATKNHPATSTELKLLRRPTTTTSHCSNLHFHSAAGTDRVITKLRPSRGQNKRNFMENLISFKSLSRCDSRI